MIEIEIDSPFDSEINPESLAQVAELVLAQQHADPSTGLSLRISDDAAIQELNNDYLGVDAPTDVLSFPVPFTDPESGHPYLGDIIIAYPTAARQAQASGHAILEEIKLLLVHGMLHLLGYDHATENEKQAMWAIQESLLQALDIQARPGE